MNSKRDQQHISIKGESNAYLGNCNKVPDSEVLLPETKPVNIKIGSEGQERAARVENFEMRTINSLKMAINASPETTNSLSSKRKTVMQMISSPSIGKLQLTYYDKHTQLAHSQHKKSLQSKIAQK